MELKGYTLFSLSLQTSFLFLFYVLSRRYFLFCVSVRGQSVHLSVFRLSLFVHLNVFAVCLYVFLLTICLSAWYLCVSCNCLSFCLLFFYFNFTPVCPTSTITTITKVTSWRGHKLVHVETAAITNTDVGRPHTTIRIPMETHRSMDNSISCPRVRAIQPTRCMGATSIFSYAGRGHLCSSRTAKSIPSKR